MKRTIGAIAVLAVLAACEEEAPWTHETARIDVPEGFRPTSRPSERGEFPFGHRDVEKRVTWELNRGGDISQIVLSKISGSVSPEQVDSAVAEVQARHRSWVVDPAAAGTLADRPSWAWSTTVPTNEGTVWARSHNVVISYPDSAYVMTFWGQHPEWQDVARMDATFSSFAIPTPKPPMRKQPLIVLGVLLLAAALFWWKRPRPEPARPLPGKGFVNAKPNPAMRYPAPGEPGPGQDSSTQSGSPGPQQGYDPTTVGNLTITR